MPKNKLFKIDINTATQFIATAELLQQDHDELLTRLINHYVKSTQEAIVDLSNKYPSFGERYPFVD